MPSVALALGLFFAPPVFIAVDAAIDTVALLATSYSAGDAATAEILYFLARRRSSRRCMTTKNEGTNRTARHVEATMPLKVDMPRDRRALGPAPAAVTGGRTQR